MTLKKTLGEAGSAMNAEFESDQGLADKFLAEADAKNLHALYQKRCAQLIEFGRVLETVTELYAGKKEPQPAFVNSTPEAVASMERVALAAIALANAVTLGPA